MKQIIYKLTADNKRPLMTTICNNLGAWLESHPALEISIKPHKSKRTNEQNKRLWAIYKVIADEVWVDGKQYSSEVWHEYCKGKFIGFDIKLLPDGSELKTPLSTTQLNTEEAANYQNAIQSWAAQEFGIIWEF